jgi:hypothetical protein
LTSTGRRSGAGKNSPEVASSARRHHRADGTRRPRLEGARANQAETYSQLQVALQKSSPRGDTQLQLSKSHLCGHVRRSIEARATPAPSIDRCGCRRLAIAAPVPALRDRTGLRQTGRIPKQAPHSKQQSHIPKRAPAPRRVESKEDALYGDSTASASTHTHAGVIALTVGGGTALSERDPGYPGSELDRFPRGCPTDIASQPRQRPQRQQPAAPAPRARTPLSVFVRAGGPAGGAPGRPADSAFDRPGSHPPAPHRTARRCVGEVPASSPAESRQRAPKQPANAARGCPGSPPPAARARPT